MSDQRQDDETVGRALGRAVEGQSVRETPFSSSRLSRELEHPARSGWLGTLAAAAAIAMFVAMGAFFVTRGPQGAAVPAAKGSATPSATSPAGVATAVPTGGPSVATPRPMLVYFARDGLPPVAAPVSTSGGPTNERPEGLIGARLSALFNARADEVPQGAINVAALGGNRGTSISVRQLDGDLATVEIGITDGWPARGAARSLALLQQLVYTITEQPGIRRAMIVDKGKPTATIDQLVIDKPLSREDVFGYVPLTAADRTIESGGSVVPSDLTARIESAQATAAQPVRLVVDFAPRPALPRGAPGPSWLPAFVATMRETTGSATAKYEVEMIVRGGTETTLRDQVIDVTPLRYVRVSAATDGTTYRLGLDDARPWRVSIEPGTSGGMRLNVDIGGHPAMVNRNIAVYSPIFGQAVTGSITISGAARVFEANVVWRLRDANGREVARGFTTATQGNSPVWGSFQTSVPIPSGLSSPATLEVFWGSPRDGSAQDLVSIPLTLR